MDSQEMLKEGTSYKPMNFESLSHIEIYNEYKILRILHFYFFKDFIYLFLERGEGKEKERKRNINCGCLSCTPPTGYRALNPGMYPD